MMCAKVLVGLGLIKSSLLEFSSVFRTNISFRNINYTQGQYIDKKTREYFYFIDHQGMVRFNLVLTSIGLPVGIRPTY